MPDDGIGVGIGVGVGVGVTRAGHAVVLGASVAGLLAARVLADHVDQVSLLDRDDLGIPARTPTAPDQRSGAPQGRHLHALMERGRQIMDELYPSLTAELTGSGIPAAETLVGTRWYFDGHRVQPVPTGLTSLLASRPALEAALRERTLSRPNVALSPGRAVGLVAAPGGPHPPGGVRVNGVRVQAARTGTAPHRTEPAGITPDGVPDGTASDGVPDGNPRAVRTIEADLVVDATGRASHAPDWLAELGVDRPQEQTLDVDLGYCSQLYRRKPDDLQGDLGVIVSAAPGLRGGGAVAQEGDRWIVTLAGMLGDHPPSDPAGFEDFAASLSAPDIHQLITGAEPLGAPAHYRFRASRRLRYDLLRTPAEGFLALGDAVCSLNPLYAQGMTVAAQQAWELRACLASDGFDRLPARFFAAAAGPIGRAWSIATDSDLRYPAVQGARGLRTRVSNAYIPRVQAATQVDPVMARTFLRVVNLVEPATTLMKPAAFLRVAQHGRRRRRG